ncbi:MAG TPA: spore coat associated protein CotJA [Candidatus Lachnoclostridium pullistercoris]|uniref:Spore coat associated protein CotJA n=1 Tax=Candidatus Lachnoclostridium pullistercoris TaxID=2838632 RepID=A0A9D2PH01_9FIRM|nr:spore coat associated protein CotJA [Candidatus Lachnoclostridium pullistercoris]
MVLPVTSLPLSHKLVLEISLKGKEYPLMDRYMPQMAPAPFLRQTAMPVYGQQTDISSFPVGMTYVPMQKWQQTYDLGLGFSRGTIFPDLDFPFVMGRCQ